MSKNLDCAIGHQQTAYLKSRQITDNLNIMQHVLEKTNELEVGSMIMSLDAEKAFDSIEHWYIKAVLTKLGLEEFIEVFDLLYSEQKVNILLNKQIAGSYRIKNGVKQGDALSCILFIMGIEPLIKNIENDSSIPHLNLGEYKIPKVLSYADDIACLIIPEQANLDAIFRHYENLTNVSGLKLNADKTEIIENLGSGSYDINYMGKVSKVNASQVIKINGIQLSYDVASATQMNMNKIVSSLDSQLSQWSKRYLSILGKIQIFKTFGLSQILFIASTVLIPKHTEKKITDLIYRFMWNNDLSKKKAPDRIKRSILSYKLKDLGFGMIDYKEVIRSIRIKSFLRLRSNKSHPMYDIIQKNVSSSIVNCNSISRISQCIDHTVKEINKSWKSLIMKPQDSDINLIKNIVLNEYTGNILISRFKSSRLGRKFRHDKLYEIPDLNPDHPIIKKLDRNIANFLIDTWGVKHNIIDIANVTFCPTRTKLLQDAKITSKTIRLLDITALTVTPKMLRNTSTEGLTKLGNMISKMTNTKLQSIALRSLHGDIYSRSRMKKFGMVDADDCERCGKTETTEHLLLECDYVRKIWNLTAKLTSITTLDLNTVLGYHDFHDKTTFTIHCEIIRRLLAIERPTQDRLKLVKSVLDRLSIVEKGISKTVIKNMHTELNKLTQSVTVLSLVASSSFDPDSSPDSTTTSMSSIGSA